MPKTTTVIAAILTLLTGLALGHLGSLFIPRLQTVPPASAISARELETARSFYDGLNHLIATGEPGVESMLALDFVDYTGSQSSGRNAEQFAADWSAIRSYLPHLRLEVIDLQVWGAMVAVRLDVHRGTGATIPGIPLTVSVASSAVEFLRIEHAKVVERWSSDDRLPGMATTLSADFDRTGPSLSGPAIQRFSLPAGQEVAFSGDDPVVLRVISGQLRLDRAAVDPHHGGQATSDPVMSGQTRIVDVADSLVLRNLSATPAEFLAFSLYGLYPFGVSGSSTASSTATRDGQAGVLAHMPLELTGSLNTRLRLSVSEVTLPTGSWVTPHTPGMVEEIVVLSGTLEVSVQSGRALISAGDGQSRPFDGFETISAGQGFSASSIATLSYQVTGAQSVTLLIMTIEAER